MAAALRSSSEGVWRRNVSRRKFAFRQHSGSQSMPRFSEVTACAFEFAVHSESGYLKRV